jgi:hypothetical protein
MHIHIQSEMSFLLHELSTVFLQQGYSRPTLDFSACSSFEIQCAMGVSEQELKQFFALIYPLRPPVKRDLTNNKKELYLFIGDRIPIDTWHVVMNAPSHMIIDPLQEQLQQLGFNKIVYKKAKPPTASMKYGGASLMVRQLLMWLCAQQDIEVQSEAVWDSQAKDIWLYLPLPKKTWDAMCQHTPFWIISDDQEMAQSWVQRLQQEGYTQAKYLSSTIHDHSFDFYPALFADYYDEFNRLQEVLQDLLSDHQVDITQHQLQILTVAQAQIQWDHYQQSLADPNQEVALNTTLPLPFYETYETCENDTNKGVDTLLSQALNAPYLLLPFHANRKGEIYPQKGILPTRWAITIYTDNLSMTQPLLDHLQHALFHRVDVQSLSSLQPHYGVSIEWGSAAAHLEIVNQITSFIQNLGEFPIIEHIPRQAIQGQGTEQADNHIKIYICMSDLNTKYWFKKLHTLCKKTKLNLVICAGDLHPLVQKIRKLPLQSFELINPQEYVESHGYGSQIDAATHWNSSDWSSTSRDKSLLEESGLADIYPLDEDRSSTKKSLSIQNLWESMGGLPTAIPTNDVVSIRYGGAHISLISYLQALIQQHSDYEVECIACWSKDDFDVVIEFPLDLNHLNTQDDEPILDWNEWFIFGPSRFQAYPLFQYNESNVSIADLKVLRSDQTQDTSMMIKNIQARIPSITLADTFLTSYHAELLYRIADCVTHKQLCVLQGQSGSGKKHLVLLLAHILQQKVLHCFASEVSTAHIERCHQEGIWLLLEDIQTANISLQRSLSRDLMFNRADNSPIFVCTDTPLVGHHFQHAQWLNRCYTLSFVYQSSLHYYEDILKYLVFTSQSDILLFAKMYHIQNESPARYTQLSTLVHIESFLKALAALQYGLENQFSKIPDSIATTHTQVHAQVHTQLNTSLDDHSLQSPMYKIRPHWFIFNDILADMQTYLGNRSFEIPLGQEAYQHHQKKSYTIMRIALKKHYLDPFPRIKQQRQIIALLENLGIGFANWNLANSSQPEL